MSSSEHMFIDTLRAMVKKKIILTIIICTIFFLAGFYFMSYCHNENTANDNLEMLKSIFLEIYDKNTDFLNDPEVKNAFNERLSDHKSESFNYTFSKFNNSNKIKSEVILLDKDYNTIYTTFSGKDFSEYLINYNNAICHKLKKTDKQSVYTSVYSDTGKYSDYMFVKAICDDNEIKGYISIYTSGNDWTYYLSDKNNDGIIIDDRNNVIYRSKAGFANNVGKLVIQNGKAWYFDNERYWVKSQELPDQNVTIYSLVYNPRNNTYMIGIVIIVIIGLIWLYVANWMSMSMAENNAKQINQLVTEIRMIQNGAYDHRIHLKSDKEFAEVGHRINRMLDSIKELNKKNTELLKLNSHIEMEQLTAQINPHFLYNTLETISILVYVNPDQASELIQRLTQILRYSVDTTYKDVRIEEDKNYIEDYIYIQKARFADNFNCYLELQDECNNCFIPKLLLQPIIENSIKYGFKVKKNISVWINGCMKDNDLILKVVDNGPGMDEKDIIKVEKSFLMTDDKNTSIGLRNTARRIYLQYGDKSQVKIKNSDKGGFEVDLYINQSNMK